MIKKSIKIMTLYGAEFGISNPLPANTEKRNTIIIT